MENSLDERLGKTKFDVFDAALACLLFIIYNFIFVEIYRLLPSNEIIYYFAQFLVEALFGVAAFTVAKARKHRFLEATGATKKVNGKLVWMALAVSVISLVFFGKLTDVFLGLLELVGYKSQLPSLEVNTFWELIIYTIISCITPAVCEEILFRGTILSGLKSFGMKVAVVCSAVIFTLMHGNAEQTIHQFIIGCIIGVIFFKTGNLWIGVLVHFFNNFIAVLSTYLLGLVARSGVVNNTALEEASGAGSEVGAVSALNIVLNIFFAVALAVIGLMLIKMVIRKVVGESEKANGKKAEGELAGTTTISVDGSDVMTTMTIDGQEVNREEKVPAVGDEQENKKEKPNAMSIATIVMFVLSGLYLVYEWILSLVVGFL